MATVAVAVTSLRTTAVIRINNELQARFKERFDSHFLPCCSRIVTSVGVVVRNNRVRILGIRVDLQDNVVRVSEWNMEKID